MKRKVTAVIMIMLLALGMMTFTGCGRNDGTDDLSQTPNNADDNLTNDNRHDTGMDDGLMEDIRDGADEIGDGIREGADDLMDGKDNKKSSN